MFGRSSSGCKHKHRSQSPHKRRIFITEAHAARPHKTIEFAVKMPGVAGDVKVLTEKTIRIPFGLLVGFSAAVTPSMFAYQPKHPNWAAKDPNWLNACGCRLFDDRVSVVGWMRWVVLQTSLVVDKGLCTRPSYCNTILMYKIIAGRIPQDRQARRWES